MLKRLIKLHRNLAHTIVERHLLVLSNIVVDMEVKAIIASPKIDADETLNFLMSFLPSKDESFSNFLRIMIANKKVYYLDEVYKLFDENGFG